uniref:Uncharacterized protein n=1 Tax=Roseihalotalea indica TaxID=2867963 RepID=A0AA49GM79_9BACT|nr:hypothetical protein K4G66_20640 [Tunicatimonas sp. TK19036]
MGFGYTNPSDHSQPNSPFIYRKKRKNLGSGDIDPEFQRKFIPSQSALDKCFAHQQRKRASSWAGKLGNLLVVAGIILLMLSSIYFVASRTGFI